MTNSRVLHDTLRNLAEEVAAAAARPTDGERARRLGATLDRIEARFGAGAIRRTIKGDDRETEHD